MPQLLGRAGLFALAAVIITACAPSPAGPSPASTPSKPTEAPKPALAGSPAASPAAASPAAAASPVAAASGSLTLYTSSPQPVANSLKAEFEKKVPAVQVTIFRAGTEDLMAKLKAEAEAKAVQADVLLVADAPTFEQLKKDDLLAAYKSPEASALLPELVDKDGYYSGTKLLSTIVAYNTQQVTTPPSGFHDLLKPEFKGKVGLPDPAVSGAASYNLVIFTNAPAFGWDYYKGLKDNGAVIVQGNPQAIEKIVSGEFAAGLVTDFDTRAAKAKGSPIDYVWPNEGVPVITEPVGITKDTKKAAAARAFIDFVLSKDGQTWAVGQNYLPGRADVPPPAGVPALKDIKMLPADAQLIMNKRPEAKQQFSQLFGR